jgi:hypothetical protein
MQMVSVANASSTRPALISSLRVHRTCRTLRLLPLPKFVAPDTTASLHEPTFSDSECLPSLKAWGKTS